MRLFLPRSPASPPSKPKRGVSRRAVKRGAWMSWSGRRAPTGGSNRPPPEFRSFIFLLVPLGMDITTPNGVSATGQRI